MSLMSRFFGREPSEHDRRKAEALNELARQHPEAISRRGQEFKLTLEQAKELYESLGWAIEGCPRYNIPYCASTEGGGFTLTIEPNAPERE